MTELHMLVSANARCSVCGAVFACEPAGACWCKDETFRLPLPDPAAGHAGCLCPTCLRDRAAKQAGYRPTR